MLNDVVIRDIMLNVVVIRVIMLNVVVIRVIMLSFYDAMTPSIMTHSTVTFRFKTISIIGL